MAVGFHADKKSSDKNMKQNARREKQNAKLTRQQNKASKARDKMAIRNNRSEAFEGGITKILGFIFVIILLAVIIRTMSGSENIPTFTGFLEMLTEVPKVEIPFLSGLATSTGGILSQPWVILDELRLFIVSLLSIIDVLIFFVNGILNVLLYVVYFFRWLFVF